MNECVMSLLDRGTGWDIFETEHGLEIQRDDESGVFVSDGDAIEHVLFTACRGLSEEARDAVREIVRSWEV
jgi:hypothetical protein